MADIIKQEDLIEKVTPSVTEEKTEEVITEPVEQDLLKKELERVQNKGSERTRREKLLYTEKRIKDQLTELDKEEGIEQPTVEEDDEAPVTIGMLKKIQQKRSVRSALDMAEKISDETERELTKYHLSNSIKHSGNPAEDLSIARAIVNATKNKHIIEEVARKSQPKTYSSASSAPAKLETEIILSHEEIQFTKPPWNMSKDEIVKTRRT